MENKASFAFIFDMDGVIVDSNPFHKIALQQFCLRHGFSLTEEQLREKIYGRSNKDWIPNVFGEIPIDIRQRYADEKEALYREIYAQDIVPVAGLVPFLEKLAQQGFPRAIATSAPRANVDFTLSKTGISSFFEVILDESYVKQSKPDPEIYLKTADALGFPPAQCIVFEDSLSGIESAQKAGCRVVGITTTHLKEELAHVDFAMGDFNGQTPSTLISEIFGAF